jgi:hypothetical protein
MRMVRRPLVAALVLVLVALAIFLLAGGDDETAPLVPGAPETEADPLAYSADDREEFERNAAEGVSHVLYAKSPGGVMAAARRTERWRQEIEVAAARVGFDPDLIEALVFLESAGRPEVIAGDDPEAATGLTQIIASTATELLGMRVELARSRVLTRRIRRAERRVRRAERRGRTRRLRKLRAARRRVDERFAPRKALAATGRYLTTARGRFRRDDLALASYHMGIGNLERALRAFAGDRRSPITELITANDLTYARLFFETTPLDHTRAYAFLSRLGDDSPTYLWRVYAAREIIRLYREDPAELARLDALHAQKASAEEVLHPRAETDVFVDPADVAAARDDGVLVELPHDPARYHFAVSGRLGELARRLDEEPELYRALRPEALALLVYLAAGAEAASGQSPLIVTSAVRDERYQRELRRRNSEATRAYSLHTTGYAFDIRRKYRSRRQALAFEFWLNRLQAMNLIAWVREPAAIHVTVSSEADRLLDVLER